MNAKLKIEKIELQRKFLKMRLWAARSFRAARAARASQAGSGERNHTEQGK